MKLENNFTIDAPIEKAWEALNNPETVAPCFPGATLTSYEGDSFAGTVKVKLGPIAMTYKGKGTYVSRDEAAHEVVIEANGRDSRGNGTANATVTASLAAEAADRTAVSMVTDMTITGKPAQFGRGVISDVADKIIGQFAACVARKLAPAAEEAAPVAVSATAASEATSDIPTAPARPRPARGGPGGRLGGDLGLGPGTGVDERRGGAGAPPRPRRPPTDMAPAAATARRRRPRGRGPRRWRRPQPPTWLPTRPRRRRPPPPAPRRPPAARGSAAHVRSEVDAIDLLDHAGRTCAPAPRPGGRRWPAPAAGGAADPAAAEALIASGLRRHAAGPTMAACAPDRTTP